jgi:hypothetical protein
MYQVIALHAVSATSITLAHIPTPSRVRQTMLVWPLDTCRGHSQSSLLWLSTHLGPA